MINNEIETAYYSSHLKFTTTGEVVVPILIRVNLISAAVISLFAFLMVLLDIKRLEDYFMKFKDAAAKIVEGDLTVTMPHTAMGNIIDHVEDSFNAMTENIRKGIVHINNHVNAMDAEIKGLDSILKHGDNPSGEIKAAVKNIKEAGIELETELSRFKVCG
ncbi:MAG: methyl-accepting chemotaxis protein [Deltaproteobacteria bacterium]|nr:methyl-accepting chemotaxis protein [Deltaproteobacteria bacterium]